MQEIRSLTQYGVHKAERIITSLTRESVFASSDTEFLFDDRFSSTIGSKISIKKNFLRTRRDIAQCLRGVPLSSQKLVDRGDVWSWLGMYYLLHNCVDLKLTKRTNFPIESFLFGATGTQIYRRRYKHYLWGTWRLDRQHGETLKFVVDRSPFAWSDLEDRMYSKARVFNSVGVMQLLERLYTRNGRTLANYGKSKGGLRHLLIVLDQLALTYDVYGMEMNDILGILPNEFREWANK